MADRYVGSVQTSALETPVIFEHETFDAALADVRARLESCDDGTHGFVTGVYTADGETMQVAIACYVRHQGRTCQRYNHYRGDND